MSELTIVLSGGIENSNFDEWKADLVEKIKSIKTELKTDDDFAKATKHVKQFKAAEKSLKAAKKSALQQASEISKLFDAIDEVTEEARQARLTLDRQIKQRKKEIKEEYVAQGVDTIKAFIAEQSSDFQDISHSDFIDDAIFEDALSGKASSKGMQKAITATCNQIKESITAKASEVDANATALASLPSHHQALFQDKEQLLVKAPEQLNKIIDERIAILEEKAKQEAEAVQQEEPEPAKAVKQESAESESSETSEFEIKVSVTAVESDAKDVLSLIEKTVASDERVTSVTLTKA